MWSMGSIVLARAGCATGGMSGVGEVLWMYSLCDGDKGGGAYGAPLFMYSLANGLYSFAYCSLDYSFE